MKKIEKVKPESSGLGILYEQFADQAITGYKDPSYLVETDLDWLASLYMDLPRFISLFTILKKKI